MKRRKPVTAQARQRISQALRGKKKKKGMSSATKKKAAAGIAVTGGLAAAALAARKKKGPITDPNRMIGAGAEMPSTALARQGGGVSTKKESTSRVPKAGEKPYRYVGGGEGQRGRRESIVGQTKRGGGRLGKAARGLRNRFK